MKTGFVQTLTALFSVSPILFGIAFMAPVLAEIMRAAGLATPFGVPAIAVGLIVGLVWGTYATVKGSWL